MLIWFNAINISRVMFNITSSNHQEISIFSTISNRIVHLNFITVGAVLNWTVLRIGRFYSLFSISTPFWYRRKHGHSDFLIATVKRCINNSCCFITNPHITKDRTMVIKCWRSHWIAFWPKHLTLFNLRVLGGWSWVPSTHTRGLDALYCVFIFDEVNVIWKSQNYWCSGSLYLRLLGRSTCSYRDLSQVIPASDIEVILSLYMYIQCIFSMSLVHINLNGSL